MSTGTGQLIFGTGHPFHGGIVPQRVLWLYENDRPAWTLAGPGDDQSDRPATVWIPARPDRILADGLLLALALGAGPDSEAAELLNSWLGSGWASGRHDLTEATRYDAKRADEVLAGSQFPGKLVIAALEGSSVLKQTGLLARLLWEIELLASAWSRSRDGFGDGQLRDRGQLPDTTDLGEQP